MKSSTNIVHIILENEGAIHGEHAIVPLNDKDSMSSLLCVFPHADNWQKCAFELQMYFSDAEVICIDHSENDKECSIYYDTRAVFLEVLIAIDNCDNHVLYFNFDIDHIVLKKDKLVCNHNILLKAQNRLFTSHYPGTLPSARCLHRAMDLILRGWQMESLKSIWNASLYDPHQSNEEMECHICKDIIRKGELIVILLQKDCCHCSCMLTEIIKDT